jgi:hypothetical protein
MALSRLLAACVAALQLLPAMWRAKASAPEGAEEVSLALPDMDMDAAEPDYSHDDREGAWQDRNRSQHRVRGEWRGSAARDAGVDVTRYGDATTFDAMHDHGQISDAQHRAASRLYRMWTEAGLNPKMCGGYGRVAGRPCIADDAETPLDRYRTAIRAFRGARADALEGVMLGRHPGAWRLAAYQGALDVLVDEWGLRDADISDEE